MSKFSDFPSSMSRVSFDPAMADERSDGVMFRNTRCSDVTFSLSSYPSVSNFSSPSRVPVNLAMADEQSNGLESEVRVARPSFRKQHKVASVHPPGVALPPVYPGDFSDTSPGPGAGYYPSRSGFGGDGSMLVGPNDPRFSGSGNQQAPNRGPQPGVPPGARFDPYGPPNIPDFNPSRFMRHRPRRPGDDGGSGRIHPDLQHFPGGSYLI